MSFKAQQPSEEKLADFARELARSFSGEIRMDGFSRILYSTDASIYQIEPLGVILPRGHDDVVAAVAAAARHTLPLLPRGGGTSLAGQTVGAAIVMDCSRFMNRILDVNYEEGWARVEPGVVLDQLNKHLSSSGWKFGPDVSTSNRATLGGMMGNNSCGSHSILYGKTLDHVSEMRVVFSNAGETRFCELTRDLWEEKARRNDFEGRLCRTIDHVIQHNRGEILARYPKVMRRVGGYNLDSFIQDEPPDGRFRRDTRDLHGSKAENCPRAEDGGAGRRAFFGSGRRHGSDAGNTRLAAGGRRAGG